MNSKACRERAEELRIQMGAMTQKLKDEKRSQFQELEVKDFDDLDRSREELLKQAETFDRVEKVDGMTQEASRSQLKEQAHLQERMLSFNGNERNQAYQAWFSHGTRNAKAQNWRMAEKIGIDPSCAAMHFSFSDYSGNTRAQGFDNTTSGAQAGFTVPLADNQLMNRIEIGLKLYAKVREVATVIRTRSGAPLPILLADPTSDLGELQTADTNASTALGDLALTVARNTLNAYLFDSGKLCPCV